MYMILEFMHTPAAAFTPNCVQLVSKRPDRFEDLDRLSHCVMTMLSGPVGFRQPTQDGGTWLSSLIRSVSMTAAAFGLTTVLKAPNVLGNVSASVKIVDEFRRPVIEYGIGVVLE
jgi:hypothetical protein